MEVVSNRLSFSACWGVRVEEGHVSPPDLLN